MSPTLNEYATRFTSNVPYWIGDPKRNDIVKIRLHDDVIIKRIIAVSFDTIEIKDGHVLINGKLLTESYTDYTFHKGFEGEHTVPSGCYFVMGDNRKESEDSRTFGFIKGSQIEGKVF